MTRILPVLLLLILHIPFSAQTTPAPALSNTYLQLLVDEDQRVRTGPTLTPQEKAKVTRTDADRLAAVKGMIAADQLTSAADFRNVAIILQHSRSSDDYLLAHTFAVLAASQGDTVALWLASASLDRYLMSIKQPQIFGTQYTHFESSKPWTQAPYNSGLISDSMRHRFDVPSIAEQKKTLDGFDKP